MRRLLLMVVALLALSARGFAAEPVRIGLDAEFGVVRSISAQAIEQGIRVAMDEINGAGGVLGGRKLELVIRDNRSVPARSQENLRELAAMPDMTAVFCGRFSPVVLETLPLLHELGLILLDPWAAADNIIDNGFTPNYVFRLSLRDRWVVPAMLHHAGASGARRVGLLLPNTAWGRSNLAAAERATGEGLPAVVGIAWYNWGDVSLARPYMELLRKGAQSVLFIANDAEARVLVREMAEMPADQRLPLVAHWGVTGGNFVAAVGPALQSVDLTIIQSFSFLTADPAKVARFMVTWRKLYGDGRPETIGAPVGVAHAYDLTHLLARAINLAGTTDRAQLRNALEHLREYDGLVRRYAPPFTPANHEALGPDNLFMARYRADGAILPLPRKSR